MKRLLKSSLKVVAVEVAPPTNMSPASEVSMLTRDVAEIIAKVGALSAMVEPIWKDVIPPIT